MLLKGTNLTPAQRKHATAIHALFATFNNQIWNLGQLTHDHKLALEWGIRHGLVVKDRVLWPWVVVGFVTKTRYMPAKAEPHYVAD